jgi:hypothetical protein
MKLQIDDMRYANRRDPVGMWVDDATRRLVSGLHIAGS